MDKIVMKNIIKRYGEDESECIALKGIDINIKDGEFVAIMGASGSGKSTLLNIIGCIDEATEGEYLLDGVECQNKTFNQLSKIRNEKIAFVFQNFALIKELTVLENILLPLEYGYKKNKKKIDYIKYIDMLGIKDLTKKTVKKLSGGQQQRVAIARALVQGSDIILADEPTGALDDENSNIIMKILTDLNKKENKTILVVTHNPNVAAYCDRTITLKDGKILNMG
ncbi:MAG: ABC transporter ATP-binding protein [Clostridium baratii]